MRSCQARSKNRSPSRSTSRSTARSKRRRRSSGRRRARISISVSSTSLPAVDDVGVEAGAWPGRASEAVRRRVSAAYSRRPSSSDVLAAVVDRDRDRAGDDVLLDPPDRRVVRRALAADGAAASGGVVLKAGTGSRPGRRPAGSTGSIEPRRRRRPAMELEAWPGTATARATGQHDDATETRMRWPGCEPIAGGAAAARGPPRPARAPAAPGSLVRAPMGQVQDPGTDLGRRPVRGDVRQPDDQRSRPAPTTARWRTTSGTPEDLERPRRAARSCRSGRAPRRAAGRAPGRWAGRRRPTTARPRVPTVGRCAKRSTPGVDRRRPRSSTQAPDQRQRAAAEPPGRRARPPGAGTPTPPASGPASAAGNGSGVRVLALEPDDGRLVIDAVVDRP